MQRLGTFEQLHCGPISAVAFVDSQRLVTASTDTTICVWNVMVSKESADLKLSKVLRGHQMGIKDIAVSPSLSTLVSVETSGRLIVWDLNSLQMLRWMDVSTNIEVCAKSLLKETDC